MPSCSRRRQSWTALDLSFSVVLQQGAPMQAFRFFSDALRISPDAHLYRVRLAEVFEMMD
ncbi:MAG: hypothetical protein KDN22_29905 [Verrucomicrobiae bacterium]|nr:hypothetical protein [Verrucomicrobiae bacterium]